VAANAICLIVAGVIRAFVPSPEFTLAWEHSVEKTRWEERYRIEGDRLALVEASVAGSGAGMEPAPGARFANGRWSWRPALAPLPVLRLAASRYARDYELCWDGHCSPLRAWIGSADEYESVELKACAAPASSRQPGRE
jgi:hypothetical protein